ncbi:hypothetical protein [Pectobacterium parmentieri]|uniref:hypothetical protein n=1 Tax=Pectobacterium parmentieri TaxID=1905730 RepID=UPI0006769BF3|nr:hypothetical protein [Pectobacterium parmentieri]PWD66913.1 hypothetical protein DF211_03990 [Pectobacterium parmentieri]
MSEERKPSIVPVADRGINNFGILYLKGQVIPLGRTYIKICGCAKTGGYDFQRQSTNIPRNPRPVRQTHNDVYSEEFAKKLLDHISEATIKMYLDERGETKHMLL